MEASAGGSQSSEAARNGASSGAALRAAKVLVAVSPTGILKAAVRNTAG